MLPKKRNLEEIVEEQLSNWYRWKSVPEREERKIRSVITISREAGSGGTAIAKKVADSLHMDLMSGQIIQEVAQSAQMSEKVVSTLDERDVSLREEWLKIVFNSEYLWPDSFLRHLMRVVSTIGRHGNAIILGRGATLILPPQETFRVRLIAPLEARINRAMAARNSSREEAEKYVVRTDSDRTAFVRKYFHTDITHPAHFDMVIDTSRVGIDGAAEVIKHAYEVWEKQRPPRSALSGGLSAEREALVRHQ
jgi:cytidylate kinase